MGEQKCMSVRIKHGLDGKIKKRLTINEILLKKKIKALKTNQKVKRLILLNKRLFYKMNRRFVIMFPAIVYGYHKKENKYFAWAQFKIKCDQYKPCL